MTQIKIRSAIWHCSLTNAVKNDLVHEKVYNALLMHEKQGTTYLRGRYKGDRIQIVLYIASNFHFQGNQGHEYKILTCLNTRRTLIAKIGTDSLTDAERCLAGWN